MPTPNNFRKIAIWLKARKAILWSVALVGLALVILPFTFAALDVTPTFGSVSFAVGVLTLTYSWGLICIESWFGKRPSGTISTRAQASFPKLYSSAKTFASWYASIFLVIWFAVGTAMAVFSLLKL
jgi:hypothetical protein